MTRIAAAGATPEEVAAIVAALDAIAEPSSPQPAAPPPSLWRKAARSLEDDER